MAHRIDYVALNELATHTHPENPKDHDIEGLTESFERFGFTVPILVDDRTGYIAAGHGRLETLETMRLALKEPPELVDVTADDWMAPVIRGWSSKDDDELIAYVIADNRHTEKGGWINDKLTSLLERLEKGPGLAGTGYDGKDLKGMLDGIRDAAASVSDGSLLALADVTVGEPDHECQIGDVFRIGERHVLVVADVMNGWRSWKPFLEGESIFVPYPGPYAALSERAELSPMVLVQPDPFLAGHLLDKFAASSDEPITKAKAGK